MPKQTLTVEVECDICQQLIMEEIERRRAKRRADLAEWVKRHEKDQKGAA